jgi:UDP-N-acetyl-D-galactosamine dehydrogenase
VDVEDPYAEAEEVLHEYGLQLSIADRNDYDAVIVALPHGPYLSLDENYYCSITKPNALIADLKGIYRNFTQRSYWSL